MNLARYQLRRWAVGLTLASLPLVGVAAAPTSLAQPDSDSDCIAGATFDCIMDSGVQPGDDLAVPVSGGPPQSAVAPAPPGPPVPAAGGSVVIPGTPPIG